MFQDGPHLVLGLNGGLVAAFYLLFATTLPYFFLFLVPVIQKKASVMNHNISSYFQYCSLLNMYAEVSVLCALSFPLSLVWSPCHPTLTQPLKLPVPFSPGPGDLLLQGLTT